MIPMSHIQGQDLFKLAERRSFSKEFDGGITIPEQLFKVLEVDVDERVVLLQQMSPTANYPIGRPPFWVSNSHEIFEEKKSSKGLML